MSQIWFLITKLVLVLINELDHIFVYSFFYSIFFFRIDASDRKLVTCTYDIDWDHTLKLQTCLCACNQKHFQNEPTDCILPILGWHIFNDDSLINLPGFIKTMGHSCGVVCSWEMHEWISLSLFDILQHVPGIFYQMWKCEP